MYVKETQDINSEYNSAASLIKLLKDAKVDYDLVSNSNFIESEKIFVSHACLKIFVDRKEDLFKTYTASACFKFGTESDYNKAALQCADTIAKGKAIKASGYGVETGAEDGQMATQEEIDMVKATPIQVETETAKDEVSEFEANMKKLQSGAEEVIEDIKPPKKPLLPDHFHCLKCEGTGVLEGGEVCQGCKGTGLIPKVITSVQAPPPATTKEEPKKEEVPAETQAPTTGNDPKAELFAKESFTKKELEEVKKKNPGWLRELVEFKEKEWNLGWDRCPAKRKSDALALRWILAAQEGNMEDFAEFVIKEWGTENPEHDMVKLANQVINGVDPEQTQEEEAPQSNAGPQDTEFEEAQVPSETPAVVEYPEEYNVITEIEEGGQRDPNSTITAMSFATGTLGISMDDINQVVKEESYTDLAAFFCKAPKKLLYESLEKLRK